MSLDNVKRVCVNIAFVFVVLFGVCINLNARIMTLETSNSDLQQTIRTQKDELEKIEEKNTMQDVIINKLNNDYNSRMAQQLQEVADENGVGG
nr:MAG TPA: Type II secretion system, protein M [Caudoviricetes sp.]